MDEFVHASASFAKTEHLHLEGKEGLEEDGIK